MPNYWQGLTDACSQGDAHGHVRIHHLHQHSLCGIPQCSEGGYAWTGRDTGYSAMYAMAFEIADDVPDSMQKAMVG